MMVCTKGDVFAAETCLLEDADLPDPQRIVRRHHQLMGNDLPITTLLTGGKLPLDAMGEARQTKGDLDKRDLAIRIAMRHLGDIEREADISTEGHRRDLSRCLRGVVQKRDMLKQQGPIDVEVIRRPLRRSA